MPYMETFTQQATTQEIQETPSGEKEASSVQEEVIATSPFFPPFVKNILYVDIGLFLVSSTGVFLKIDAVLAFWFVAALVSLLSVIYIFLLGIVLGLKGKGYRLVGAALVVFLVLFVIGGGVCAFNVSGLSI